MSSVVATWKGRCASRIDQSDLLWYTDRIAGDHADRWRKAAARRPTISDLLNRLRSDGLPVEPDIRRWNETLRGRIAVCADVAPDATDFELARKLSELPLAEGTARIGRPGHIWLGRLDVRGIDFRLYDPRELYPGEDRFSCVFLRSDRFHFIDGLIAKVSGEEWCERIAREELKGADWYVEAPHLHLRGHLEEWAQLTLAWMRYFFAPDLQYWIGEPLAGYEEREEAFDDDRIVFERKRARGMWFDRLRSRFETEADDIERFLAEG